MSHNFNISILPGIRLTSAALVANAGYFPGYDELRLNLSIDQRHWVFTAHTGAVEAVVGETVRDILGLLQQPMAEESIEIVRDLARVTPDTSCADLQAIIDRAVLLVENDTRRRLGGAVKGPDAEARTPGCQCHLEVGDSPCRIHGEDE